MGIVLLSLIVVSILVFTGTFYLFKKLDPGVSPSKKPLYWITAFIAIPIVYLGSIYIWFSISSSYPERSFDKTAWAENIESRYEYVDDLVNSKILIGLSNEEAINVLGEPDNQDDSTLTFYIGYCPKYFLNMDPDWLELEIKNGKVYNSRILQ